MKQIIVLIDPDGNTEIEVEGMAGSGCKEATKALEEALGVVTKTTNKTNFYRQEVTSADRIRTQN